MEILYGAGSVKPSCPCCSASETTLVDVRFDEYNTGNTHLSLRLVLVWICDSCQSVFSDRNYQDSNYGSGLTRELDEYSQPDMFFGEQRQQEWAGRIANGDDQVRSELVVQIDQRLDERMEGKDYQDLLKEKIRNFKLR